eukprot:g3619.t1
MSNFASAEDKDMYAQAFIIFDRDGDGKVNIKDFQDSMKALGREVSDADAKDLLGGDSVDEAGFITVLSNLKQGTPTEAEVLDALQVFDRGNGTIKAKELLNAMTNMGTKPLNETEAKMLVKSADVDGDGLIDYKSWTSSVMNFTTDNGL